MAGYCSFKLPMEPFYEAVTGGMIRSCSTVLESDDSGQVLEERRFELASPVCYYIRWATKAGDPST